MESAIHSLFIGNGPGLYLFMWMYQHCSMNSQKNLMAWNNISYVPAEVALLISAGLIHMFADDLSEH